MASIAGGTRSPLNVESAQSILTPAEPSHTLYVTPSEPTLPQMMLQVKQQQSHQPHRHPSRESWPPEEARRDPRVNRACSSRGCLTLALRHRTHPLPPAPRFLVRARVACVCAHRGGQGGGGRG